MDYKNLGRFAWLSIGAAVATILLKASAYFLTGSVGLLSDALESVINLVAAIVALWMLKVASLPPDEEHSFGHHKAEYFSSIVEGGLIIIAALGIIFTAIQRLITPQPLEQVGIGLAVNLLATVINLVVALKILQAGKQAKSITLEANGKHLMTDVWTSVGVVAGVGLVYWTKILAFDSVVAILVAANILWSGAGLVKRSVYGLLDTAISAEELKAVNEILEKFVREKGIAHHALRTREAGTHKFVSVHILVPGQWTVQKGHELLEVIESQIAEAVTNVVVFTHLEPLEDEASWQDIELIRR